MFLEVMRSKPGANLTDLIDLLYKFFTSESRNTVNEFLRIPLLDSYPVEILHNLHHVRSCIASKARTLDIRTHLLIFDAILGELPLLHRCKNPEHIAGIPMPVALF